MNFAPFVPLIVQGINLLAEYGPKIGSAVVQLWNDVRNHKDLSAGGAALLDKHQATLLADQALVDAHKPLPPVGTPSLPAGS